MNALLTLGLPLIRAEIYLVLVALFLLLYGAYKNPRASVNLILVSVFALLLTGYLAFGVGVEPRSIFQGMFVSDGFTLFAKLLIISASVGVILLATPWLLEESGRPFEFLVLIMLSTLGMMLMVSAGSFLALYMALEMSSLALYVLASFNRDGTKSTEAGLKYFVLGALASGMILFGISLVYGFAGSIQFETLAVLFSQSAEISKAVIVGLVFILVGFCFKLSAAPLHMWTPDVYEGAPTPVTAFLSTASKVAAMLLAIRVLFIPFAEMHMQWQQIIIVVAVLSMLVGAFAAIAQTNLKRLLAYSSIGHVGFMLMGVATGTLVGIQAVLIYLALYVFMSVGMFACVVLSGREQIRDYAGLSKTRPILAAAIAVFMFSMAGIPPLSGFFGKMWVVLALVEANLLWLAVLGVLISVVSCYYYLKIVKVMYFDGGSAHGTH